jgi:hypothetical protein
MTGTRRARERGIDLKQKCSRSSTHTACYLFWGGQMTWVEPRWFSSDFAGEVRTGELLGELSSLQEAEFDSLIHTQELLRRKGRG